MGRKYRKYTYNKGGNRKKIIILAVSAAILALICGAAALFLTGGIDLSGNTATLQSLPYKTVYQVGDEPNWEGLGLKITSPEGTSMTYGPKSCSITGFDSSNPAENQVITVKYKNYKATFTVSIRETVAQDAPQGFFWGMSFASYPKTQYKVGEALDVTGGSLSRHYTDDSSRELALTADMVSGFDSSKPGTYTLTVTYAEDDYPAELTYEITVTD